MLIYVSGTPGDSHDEDVKTSVINGWTDAGGNSSNLTVEIKSDSISNLMDLAIQNGATFVVRSYSGIESYLTIAEKYNNVVGFLMPPGSNSPGEVFSYSIPQAMIVIASGDNGINETADNCEFVEQDPITAESTPDELDLSSFANGYAAGKLAYIYDQCSCSIWQARNRAHKTGTENGVWHEVNGYGAINVTDAINYSDTLDANPFPMSTGTITARDKIGKKITLDISWVNGADQYKLYRNDVEIATLNPLSLTYQDTVPDFGTYAYKSKAFNIREGTETGFTNVESVTFYKPNKLLIKV